MATNKSSKYTKSAKTTKKSAGSTSAKTSSKAVKKKRQLKAAPAPVSLREQVNMAANKPAKRNNRGRLAKLLTRPFLMIFRALRSILRPFSFLLAPFKTRPARAVGRFLASVLLFRYFRNSWNELRQVEWPNARETTKLTFAVFAFAIFFTLIVSLADWVIGNVVEKLIIN